jgi:hypothetical protein
VVPQRRDTQWGHTTPCLPVRGRCSHFDATGVLVEGVRKTTIAYLLPVEQLVLRAQPSSARRRR